MRIKKISDYEYSTVYALVEATDSEAEDVKLWLEENCKGLYRMDRLHIVLRHGSDIMFALKWGS